MLGNTYEEHNRWLTLYESAFNFLRQVPVRKFCNDSRYFWKFRFLWSVGSFCSFNNTTHLKLWQYFNYFFDKNFFTFILSSHDSSWRCCWKGMFLKIRVFLRPLFRVSCNSDLSFIIYLSKWLTCSFNWFTSNELLSIRSRLSFNLAEFAWLSSNAVLVDSSILLIKLTNSTFWLLICCSAELIRSSILVLQSTETQLHEDTN